jgi:glycosyltransferase involved in cell wall biosynthesis
VKIYCNRPEGGKNSLGVVTGKLAPVFRQMGSEVTFSSKDKWDVCLAFMYEKDPIVFAKGKVVQRLDGIYLDNDIQWKESNAPLIRTYRKTNGIIFQSEFSRKVIFKNFGIPHAPYVVIPNGAKIVDGENSEQILRDRLPELGKIFDTYPNRLVAAAQWRPSKRLGSVISGAEHYFKQNSQACLFILGDVESKIQSKVKDRCNRIFFLGRVEHDLVSHFYKCASACINLSIMDACPNSVIEAMAHGTPVVVTKHQGVVELMNETSGYVINDSDWDYGPLSFTKDVVKVDPILVAAGISHCIKIGRSSFRYDLDVAVMGKKYHDFLLSVKK